MADVIIGCDGIKSRILAALYSDMRMNYTVATAFRALLARDQLSANDILTPVVSFKFHFWLGPGAHVVLYPIHGGETFNLVIVIQNSLLRRLCKNENALELVMWHLMGWNPVVTELLQTAQGLMRFQL
ncbi:hypothetical protein B0J13DRAFT_541675 [Dactylonectria estremocensis]|uniref:FAD-binding domain-containing protein n=1 Tax=Dactylonectria estremocensis TaxID=1079267 RepID=A0A9P9FBE9_9HYPO|nr:hypothetical protein B0J13DRAFT_541675 [Dactylonectria estremocensis]